MKSPSSIFLFFLIFSCLHSLVSSSLNQTLLSQLGQLEWNTIKSTSISLPWVMDRSGFCSSDFCFFVNCRALDNSDVLEVSLEVPREILECLTSNATFNGTQGKYLEWRTTLRHRGFNIEVSNFTVCVEEKSRKGLLCNDVFNVTHPFSIEKTIEIHHEGIHGLGHFLNESSFEEKQTFVIKFFISLQCGYTDTDVFVNDWLFVFDDSCNDDVNEGNGGKTIDETTTTTSTTTSTTGETNEDTTHHTPSSSTPPSTHPSSTSDPHATCLFGKCSDDIECDKGEFCDLMTCECESSPPISKGTTTTEENNDENSELSEVSFGLAFSMAAFIFSMAICCCLSFFSKGFQRNEVIQFKTFSEDDMVFNGKLLFRKVEKDHEDDNHDTLIQKRYSPELTDKTRNLEKSYPSFFIEYLFDERFSLKHLYIEDNGNYGEVSSYFSKDVSTKFSNEQRLYFCYSLLFCARTLRRNDINIIHSRLTPSNFFLFKNVNKSRCNYSIKLFGTLQYSSIGKSLNDPSVDENERLHYYPPETSEEMNPIYNRQSENWTVGMSLWAFFNMETPMRDVKDKKHYDAFIFSGSRPEMNFFQSEMGIDKNMALSDMLLLEQHKRRNVEKIDLDWFTYGE